MILSLRTSRRQSRHIPRLERTGKILLKLDAPDVSGTSKTGIITMKS
jgi:hypothetical protein